MTTSELVDGYELAQVSMVDPDGQSRLRYRIRHVVRGRHYYVGIVRTVPEIAPAIRRYERWGIETGPS